MVLVARIGAGARTVANHYRESPPTLNLIEPPWYGPVWWCGRGGTARCPPIPIHPQTNLPVRKIFMSRQKKPNNPERANACSARKLILPQLLRLAGASNDFADLGRRESALRHLSRAGK